MLRTWDLHTTVSFYTDVLGFTCDSISDESGWASLRRDNVNIMLGRPNQHEGGQVTCIHGFSLHEDQRRGRAVAAA